MLEDVNFICYIVSNFIMRITGGQLKGKRIFVPSGFLVRPPLAKIREAIFQILPQCWEGKRVLDLYAGCGSFGLEALSRGAESVIFVEKERVALSALRKNVESCRYRGKALILPMNALRAIPYLGSKNERFDVVFVDPPFEGNLSSETMEALDENGLVRDDGWVVLRHSVKEIIDASYGQMFLFDQRRYGRSLVSFFIKKYG